MKKLGFTFIALGFILGFSVIPLSPSSNGSVFSGGLAKASGGGPIVLDGMDPVCHSGWESTGQYIARVLKKVHEGANNSNNGHIAILGSNATTTSCGANWTTQLNTQFLAEFTVKPTIDFYTTDAQINLFFSSTINTETPALVWIPDNWSRAASTETIFTTNAEKIADFVNSGGGLFANFGTYGWLTALLPSAVYNNGGCNGGPEATADGIADFALNNTIVAACWHGYFTGGVGTLKTLVDYPYPSVTDTRKSVSIGGGSVSLPSSFTLSVSPQNPEAGQDIVITATAQTLAGIPQAGVVVTVTVSSGPDAGTTLTGITNSSGIATITVRTSSIGTAVYTATATVNGIAKTVSATVIWDPPTVTTTVAPSTTITPETTTLVPQTTIPTSTTVAPTTTKVPEITPVPVTIVDVPTIPVETTTTIHDHSSHSHQIAPSSSELLPKTGLKIIIPLLASLLLILLGLTLSKTDKNTPK